MTRRPTDEDKIMEALDLYEAGRPLAGACRDVGIGVATIYERCKKSDVIKNRLEQSHELHGEAMVLESIEVADSEPDPQRARVRMMARQWVASRVARKRWGDRVDIQVEQKVSITAALEAAEQRLRLGSDLIIDGEAHVVEDKAQTVARSTDSQSDSELPDPFA
jgi:hypothetical protein